MLPKNLFINFFKKFLFYYKIYYIKLFNIFQKFNYLFAQKSCKIHMLMIL